VDRATFNALTKYYSEQARALLGPKNEGYARDDDALLNFRLAKHLGFSMAQGVLTRMGDKLSRVAKLISMGNASVYNETIVDTLLDLQNYANILLCVLVEEGMVPNPLQEEGGSVKEGEAILTPPSRKGMCEGCKDLLYCILPGPAHPSCPFHK